MPNLLVGLQGCVAPVRASLIALIGWYNGHWQILLALAILKRLCYLAGSLKVAKSLQAL